MKIDLLPRVERYFKTNLHTHSNISDGKLTPWEVVEAYKAAGYQVLSITDHNVVADHSDKTSDELLLLTGVEININDDLYKPTHGFAGVTYHLNLISKTPHNLWQPTKVPGIRETAAPYEALVESDNMPRVYDLEAVNAIIARSNEKGYLVMYNHPVWSRQRYPEYIGLKGLWAMEMRNTGCVRAGFNENNHRIYQDMLEAGMHLYPTGTDDAHSRGDMFGAWIMVGARELAYEPVIRALEQGDFYMSCGPEIHSLALDDGFLEIECSDASLILVETHARAARRVQAQPGSPINHARIDLTKFFYWAHEVPKETEFFRVTVFAPDGSYAATRAYWLKQIPTEAMGPEV